MKWLASIDGAIKAPEEAKVSVHDRGLLHGDSIFETARPCGGKPLTHACEPLRSSPNLGVHARRGRLGKRA